MVHLFHIIFSVSIVVLSQQILDSTACGGYKLNVDYIRNCGKNNSVILSNDFYPILHDDCTVTMVGCSTVKKGFKTAQIHYELTRNGVRYSGTKNACQMLEYTNDELQSMLDVMGLPKLCPVKEETICGDGKQISIRRHRLKLPMVAGTTKGRAELKTDSGNACFEFSAALNRKFFSG